MHEEILQSQKVYRLSVRRRYFSILRLRAASFRTSLPVLLIQFTLRAFRMLNPRIIRALYRTASSHATFLHNAVSMFNSNVSSEWQLQDLDL